MKNLWSPWRMDYILGNEELPRGCIFDVPTDDNSDRERLVLFRDATIVVLLNRFPYANGHLLVAPNRHLPDITELDDGEAAGLMAMLQNCIRILRKNLQPDGFNIGLNLGETAGAGLAGHLHFHVVPRWEGDHNFMTTIAAVRTIPEHIKQTFDRLVGDFQSLAPDNRER